MELLIGMLLMWGFIPLGLGVGLSYWAGGNRFPVALLKAFGAMVIFFLLGVFMVDDARSDYFEQIDNQSIQQNAG